MIKNRVALHQFDIAIIGGGVGGCVTALEVAASLDKKVLLIDKKDSLLEGTSNVTPGRMGLGFDYIHEETAVTYLRSTIEFVKRYLPFISHLRVGEEYPESHYLRRGRYFIVKDSLYDKERILRTYEMLRKEYRLLCEEDPKNQVFGLPDNLYRILDETEYEYDINKHEVICGIETAEHLLDWSSFKQYILQEISNSKNIKVLTDCDIQSVDINSSNSKYCLLGKGRGEKRHSTFTIEVENVVNACWENVKAVNYKAGMLTPKQEEEERTNRLKILVEVGLPETLTNKNSMFFCMGPHCMFSNMGDGRGLLTYAPVNNFMESTATTVPSKMVAYLNKKNNDIKYQEIAKNLDPKELSAQIVKGVSQYIPAMKDAQLLTARFGVVITKGDVNIFDHKSPFHQRNYSGVCGDFPTGWISNTCMKLLYAYTNALEVIELLQSHNNIRKNTIPPLAKKMSNYYGKDHGEDIKKYFNYYLQRYLTYSELNKPLGSSKKQGISNGSSSDQLTCLMRNTIFNKTTVVNGLKERTAIGMNKVKIK